MPSTRVKVRVKYATIFIFPAGGRSKSLVVSTSPERLTVREGDLIDWTVVDATGQAGTRKVSFTWKERSPLKEEPKAFPRFTRATVRKAKPGLYKYSVAVDGEVLFDPEIEIMS